MLYFRGFFLVFFATVVASCLCNQQLRNEHRYGASHHSLKKGMPTRAAKRALQSSKVLLKEHSMQSLLAASRGGVGRDQKQESVAYSNIG